MVNYWNEDQVKLMLKDFYSAMLAEAVITPTQPLHIFCKFTEEWVKKHFFFEEEKKGENKDATRTQFHP